MNLYLDVYSSHLLTCNEHVLSKMSHMNVTLNFSNSSLHHSSGSLAHILKIKYMYTTELNIRSINYSSPTKCT